jgi:hypothetical protein
MKAWDKAWGYQDIKTRLGIDLQKTSHDLQLGLLIYGSSFFPLWRDRPGVLQGDIRVCREYAFDNFDVKCELEYYDHLLLASSVRSPDGMIPA